MDTHKCPDCGEAMPGELNGGMCPACLQRTRPGDGMPWISDVTLGFSDDAPSPKGEMTGRYHVVKEHARGGMGRILLAHDPDLGRDVALKQLLPMSEEGIGAGWTPTDKTHPVVARFLREARITGQLEHPSITPVHELGQNDDGSFYYTMKFVKGRTLAEVIKECKNLKERLKLLPHFVDLCNAIAYAHSKGVIHRDIKPQNVLIGEFGETVVVDWGLAKIKDKEDVFAKELQETLDSFRNSSQHEADKTVAGTALGTPTYMPPEQVRGELFRIDERSDIYSLGVVLYQILTGTLPFHGRNISELFAKVLDDAPPSPLKLDRNIPEDLAQASLKAMSKKPADRFATAKELGQLVEGSKLRAPKSRMRKFAERGALTLAVGIPLFIIVANWYTGHRLENIKARMESEGISTSGNLFQATETADLKEDVSNENAPPKVDSLGAIYALEMKFPRYWERLKSEEFNRPMVSSRRRFPGAMPLPEAELDTIRGILAEYQNVLTEVHQIANMPTTPISSEMQLYLTKGKHAQEVNYPNFLGILICSKLLTYESMVKLHDGDMDGAFQCILDSVRFAMHTREIPTILGAMINNSIIRQVLYAAHPLLHDGQYTVAQLASLKDLLDGVNMQNTLESGWKDDVHYGVDLFQTIKTDPEVGAEFLKRGVNDDWHVIYVFALLYGSWPLRFWLNNDEAYYLENMERSLLLTRRPFYEVKKELEVPNEQSVIEKIIQFLYHPLMTFVNFNQSESALRSHRQLTESVSSLAMARMALSLREMHEATGTYPETLDVLAPGYLTVVPLDPFTGQPFVYQHDADGFTLYSAGADGEVSLGVERRRTPYDTQTVIMEAAQDYKLQHGKFPQSIQEMVPEFFNEVPIAFETGQPYQLRVEGDKPVVECVDAQGNVVALPKNDDVVWVGR